MWPFKKEEKVTQKQTITPNLPIIQALGKLGVSYKSINSRQTLSNTLSTVSEVYAPIVYMASAFSNMRPRLYKLDSKGSKTEEIHTHEVLSKLAAPNPLQDWKSFLFNRFFMKKGFGNSYIYKYQLSGFKQIKDSTLWILPSQYTYTVPNITRAQNYFNGNNIEEFTRGYMLFATPNPKHNVTFTPDLVLHEKEINVKRDITDPFINLMEGMSPLETLVESIANIKKSYEAQNVILSKRGALGILTPKNGRDGTNMGVVFTGNQKDELQKELQNYGLSPDQWQVIISNVEMTWQQMSMPIKDLMLFEGIGNSMIAICNSLNFPILLMNYLKGSTFTNIQEVKKSLYQDNIVPEGNSFMSSLNTFLGLPEMGLKLEADFRHIPVLQTDLKTEAEKDEITIRTILNIQTAIFEGKINIEQGQAMLLNILGLSNQEANQMLTNNTNDGNSTIQ